MESTVCLCIIVMISLAIYFTLSVCLNIKGNLLDKIELQQQSIEITKQIERLTKYSSEIEIEGADKETSDYIDGDEIKLSYSVDDSETDKDIYMNRTRRKIFVTSLINGRRQSGGYEIGDYVDSIKLKLDKSCKKLSIVLQLSKNSQVYKTGFSTMICNY